MNTVTITLRVDEAKHLLDMVDRERQGHLNRLSDFVLWAEGSENETDRARLRESAISSARAAEDARQLRARIAGPLRAAGH